MQFTNFDLTKPIYSKVLLLLIDIDKLVKNFKIKNINYNSLKIETVFVSKCIFLFTVAIYVYSKDMPIEIMYSFTVLDK